jgi:hypothetical protein
VTGEGGGPDTSGSGVEQGGTGVQWHGAMMWGKM